MKVLVISNSVRPDCGTGRYTYAVVSELARLGVGVAVLTEESRKGSSPTGVDEISQLLPVRSIGSFLKNIIRVRRMARSFDVVHAFDGWPYGIYGLAAVWGTKKRFFVNGVGTYSMVPRRGSPKRLLMRAMYRRARMTFCISNYVLKRIQNDTGVDHIKTVFLGTTPLPVLGEETLARYRQRYQIGQHTPVLITVGAIKHRKGQLDTLRAVARLKKDYANIVYLIVGSDRDKEYVGKINTCTEQENLEDNVRIITDAHSDEDLTALYQISDLFLLNSNNEGDHMEGFGLVILEAAQFGVPAVGSRGCGIEDAIENGYNGYLTEQQNAGDIATRSAEILKDLEKYSPQAKEFSARFSWERTAQEYRNQYNEL